MASFYDDFHKFVTGNNHVDEIYQAIGQDDLSEGIITTLDIMKKTRTVPSFKREEKSEQKSVMLRNLGNQAYSVPKYEAAKEYYNKAILYAPKNSEAMKLAYSNRSALLLKAHAYTACLNDIETCLDIGCSSEIFKKLVTRKVECEQFQWRDRAKENPLKTPFAEGFFNFNVKRHRKIPCASSDVEVIIENGLPKIVAAKNIKVGTIVALETPYISHLEIENYNRACYYCHRRSLNLTPCDGCTYALFCNEECKENCMKDYHRIECHIMELLESIRSYNYNRSASRLAIKAVLKLKEKCSWKELIELSYNIGVSRMKNSSVSAIFDVNNKFSILSFDESNIHFIHGSFYNFCIRCAPIIYYLSEIPSYMPETPEENSAAQSALARLMATLYLLFPKRLPIYQSAENLTKQHITNLTEFNYGWFSFASKLKHSCDSNLNALGLKNDVALISLHPIKKGEELTLSFLGHWYENIHITVNNRSYREIRLFKTTNQLCKCSVCVNMWSIMSCETPSLLSDALQRALRKLQVTTDHARLTGNDELLFKATCEALAVFQEHGMRNTRPHYDLFQTLRKYLCVYQFLATKNAIMEGNNSML